MAGQKTISHTHVPIIAPPTPPHPSDYVVSGNLIPNVAGYYVDAGIFDGFPYYQDESFSFYIWRSIIKEKWIISDGTGQLVPRHWITAADNILGIYQPQLAAIGIATVTEGVPA